MNFPRTRNGYTDTGKAINNRVCPNCGSATFKETISSEYCPKCELLCDYWGDGPNDVYNQHCNRIWREREEKEREEIDAELSDE